MLDDAQKCTVLNICLGWSNHVIGSSTTMNILKIDESFTSRYFLSQLANQRLVMSNHPDMSINLVVSFFLVFHNIWDNPSQ